MKLLATLLLLFLSLAVEAQTYNYFAPGGALSCTGACTQQSVNLASGSFLTNLLPVGKIASSGASGAPLIGIGTSGSPSFTALNLANPSAVTGILPQGNILTCAASEIVFDNLSGQLSCSSAFKFTTSNNKLLIGSSGLPGELDLTDPGQASGAQTTRVTLDSSGNWQVIPIDDSGAPIPGSSLVLFRDSTGISQLTYTDSSSESFAIAGNFASNITWTAVNNSAPSYISVDGGTTGALAGFQALAGASSAQREGVFYCLGAQQVIGATLNNGPSTGAYCVLSVGDQFYNAASGNAPLLFGTNGNLAGQIGASQGWAIGTVLPGSAGTLNVQSQISIGGSRIFPTLNGTTGSIGGGALLAGACTSGTVNIAGATTSMATVATPATYPGDGVYWDSYVSSTSTVTVKVCATIALTPTASTYVVRVLQ